MKKLMKMLKLWLLLKIKKTIYRVKKTADGISKRGIWLDNVISVADIDINNDVLHIK